MSYEAAVLVSILRSLVAGLICVWLGRVLVAWRSGRDQLPAASDQGERIEDSSCEVDGVRECGIPPHPGPLPRIELVSDPRADRGGEGGRKTRVSDLPTPPLCLRASVVNILSRFTCTRRFTAVVLLLPFFMPGLVIGYAYRNASLSLVQAPLVNELLYLAIVVSQLVPVAVLTLEWLPPAALGPSGAYCLQLTPKPTLTSVGAKFRTLLAGEFPRRITAGVVVTLLCFQEVEVATLMQARGWAEWIFTKQAGGVELVDVWGSLVLPVVYGLGLVVPVLGYWMGRNDEQSRQHLSRTPAPQTVTHRAVNRRIAMAIVTIGWLLTVIWPVTSLTIGAWRGAGVIQLRSAIWQEIGDALILAVTVTSLLGTILWGIGKFQYVGRLWPGQFGRQRKALTITSTAFAMLPGLLGSLALGLLIFEICQQIGCQPAYTPVPLVAGMVLFLLPRAIVMQAMMRWSEVRPDVFLAERLTRQADRRADWGAAILWKLRGAGRFWTLALLFWWSYLELTLPSLLRPAGMAPAPMRLYNFLHYGHIPGLAAMLVLVLAVPLVLLFVGHRWQSRQFRTTLR
jgi:ABC-type Fe3+ transport system permease subunit